MRALGNHETPAFAGVSSCAEEDSNLHGPFSPQGPQPGSDLFLTSAGVRFGRGTDDLDAGRRNGRSARVSRGVSRPCLSPASGAGRISECLNRSSEPVSTPQGPNRHGFEPSIAHCRSPRIHRGFRRFCGCRGSNEVTIRLAHASSASVSAYRSRRTPGREMPVRAGSGSGLESAPIGERSRRAARPARRASDRRAR
jgi:hypothetical protein